MFITTTLPYVNSSPHIGHAYEFILGDAITRFFRGTGKVVSFNIGLDEHGSKVAQKATTLGITPQEHITILRKEWVTFTERFQIVPTNFYMTATAEHAEKVQQIWKRLELEGLIYPKTYKGKYCIGCEAYKTEKDIPENKCPDHPTTDIIESEELNYFFRLESFKPALKAWLAASPEFLLPSEKRKELENQLEEIEDISISRTKESCSWGVEVPNDASQTVYVWFDALLNYIFAAGYPSSNFEATWQEVIQLCGPDNLRFQAVIFQGILEALCLPHTSRLLVHGTILDSQGKKMSKSLGNTVDPIQELDSTSLDAVRYYALAGLNTYANSKWDRSELIRTYNTEVVNDWGNTLSRVLHLVNTKTDKNPPAPAEEYISALSKDVEAINDAWAKLQPREGLQLTNKLIKKASTYIDATRPWEDKPESKQVIGNLYYLLQQIAKLYAPVLTDSTPKVLEAIVNKEKAIIFPKL